LIKNTGEVSAHYQYDPFGNTLTVADSTAFANPYRFSTKSWDVQAELMYYGSRFYCSANGRWLNRDPIAENGRKNLFEFAMNNANDMIDYNGKQAMPPSFERPRWPWPSEIDSCDEARKIVADYIASLKEDGNPEDNYSIELFEDFLSKTGEPFVASDEQVYQIRNSKQFRNGLEKEIESKIKKVCRGKRKGESVSMDLDGNFRVEYTMWSNSSLWLAIGGGTIYYSIFMTIKCKCSAMGCGTFEMRDFYSFEPGGYRRYHRAYNAFHYLQLRCGYKPFDSTAVGGVCYNDGDVDNWG
jgi:RHS repeat-associated protein